MRLHREHLKRPEKKTNEENSRGANQDDKPEVRKKAQRLTKQAQLCFVLLYCINTAKQD